MQPAAQTSVAQVCLKPRWCYSSESEGLLSSHSEALPNSTELEINLHQQLVKKYYYCQSSSAND